MRRLENSSHSSKSILLPEATVKQIVGKAASKFKTIERGSKMTPEFVGVSRDGAIHFRVLSSVISDPHPSKKFLSRYWQQRIIFPELVEWLKEFMTEKTSYEEIEDKVRGTIKKGMGGQFVKKGTPKEEVEARVKQSIESGNVLINCNCPSFLYYGWKYISWKLKYGDKSETRPPKRNNPTESGTMCKHLYAVLSRIQRFIPQISQDILVGFPLGKQSMVKKEPVVLPKEDSDI